MLTSRKLSLLLGAGMALCGFAAEPSPSPTQPPDMVYGTTPVDACPRFFIGLSLAAIDGCADRLADAGWGLSAVEYRRGYDQAGDRFSGAFEPHSPKRWLVSDDDAAVQVETETGFKVDVVDAIDHIVIEYQRGTAQPCEDLLLYAIDFHVPDKRKYFSTKMSEKAALGCIPASYYEVLRKSAIMQENSDEYIAFVPGDPHANAAFWAAGDADQAAFEKRAAARGFFRLALGNPPDRWGKSLAPTYAESIALGSEPGRFSALERRLQEAVDAGERIAGVALGPDQITILWERPPPS
jgi:hypothetical protein